MIINPFSLNILTKISYLFIFCITLTAQSIRYIDEDDTDLGEFPPIHIRKNLNRDNSFIVGGYKILKAGHTIFYGGYTICCAGDKKNLGDFIIKFTKTNTLSKLP